MAKSFQCRHAGVLCGARITGETEDEVVEKAIAHARKEHGVDLSGSRTLRRYAASLVRDESAGAESRG